MTGYAADRERFWTDTQEWLDARDRLGGGADFHSRAADLDAAEYQQDRPDPLSRAAGEGADGDDDRPDFEPAADDDRAAHLPGAPVDPDNSAAEPADSSDDAPEATERPDDDHERPADAPAAMVLL